MVLPFRWSLSFQLTMEELTAEGKWITENAYFHYLIISATLIILTKIFYNVTNRRKSSKKSNDFLGVDDIPGEKPMVPGKWIGNVPKLLPFTKTVDNAMKWIEEYPGLFKVIGANQTFVVFTDPPIIQQLFKSSDFGHNVKAPFVYDLMKPFISNGVLVSTGSFWQNQRKLLMRTQRYQSLKAYMEMLNRHGNRFVEMLDKLYQDDKPHQVNEAINFVFLKVICEMITGKNATLSEELDRYHHNFQIWKAALVKRLLNPWLLFNTLWKLHPMSGQQSSAINEMFDFAKRRVTEHKVRRKDSLGNQLPSTTDEHPLFRSVLDELLDGNVEENQIIDEVNTMLFGGHETGATAIHFFCFCMALNQDIQEICRKEIDILYENPVYIENGEITYDAVQCGSKYLERCLHETLRLFPPVFMMFRQLETEFSFTHNSKQYKLPVGSILTISPLGTHRMQKYFPDPLKFNPDRFLPEEIAKRHPFAYIPFSGGSRNCLGMKFAMIEMKVIAAYMLRNFVIKTSDKMEEIPLLPFITLTPAKDYTFEFIRRRAMD